jgi:hypothetical protein
MSTDVHELTMTPDVSSWPALVTLGRAGSDELLVDLTRVGIVALTGDRVLCETTMRSVWSELRWPADNHELEVVSVGGSGIADGARELPWSHALSLLERGPERSRPLVVLAFAPPAGDDAVRLAAATRPDRNVGVLLAGSWDCVWQLLHSNDGNVLRPLGISVSQVGLPVAPTPAVAGKTDDGVRVSVLGPVEVAGRSLSAKETELVAFLATRAAGATEAQIRTALWPDRDAPRGTFNNLVSATRRQLGRAEDGGYLLPRVSEGRYRLHASVTCDLDQLEAAFERCAQGDDANDVVDALLATNGRPFDGWAGADWPFDDAVVARAEVVISKAARLVGKVGGDRAASAVVKALAAVPDPSIEDALRQSVPSSN